MGDFSEHVLFGFLSALLVVYVVEGLVALSAVEVYLSALTVFVGSVLPDIDHKNAYVFRAVRAFTALFGGVFVFVYVPFQAGFRFVASVLVFLSVFAVSKAVKIRHRGWTHSLSFSVTVSAVAGTISLFAVASFVPGVAFFVGLLSHLVLDEEFKL